MQISNGHACAIDRVNKRGTRSRRGSERASSGGRLPGARSWRPETGTIRRDRIARLKEDVKKSRQRKGREDRKEESFEKMLCALCDLCVQRDSFTSSKAVARRFAGPVVRSRSRDAGPLRRLHARHRDPSVAPRRRRTASVAEGVRVAPRPRRKPPARVVKGGAARVLPLCPQSPPWWRGVILKRALLVSQLPREILVLLPLAKMLRRQAIRHVARERAAFNPSERTNQLWVVRASLEEKSFGDATRRVVGERHRQGQQRGPQNLTLPLRQADRHVMGAPTHRVPLVGLDESVIKEGL